MKVLLHICCAPCAAYPIEALKEEGLDITGFWFNPNIHPYLEYRKRLWEVRRFCEIMNIPLLEQDIYSPGDFLKKVLLHSPDNDRCSTCYELRLRKTADVVVENEIDAFTTTMLYSKHLRHDEIRSIGEKIAHENSIDFLYRDFRTGWSRGLTISRKFNLYRQQYCGCVMSEFERFRDTADDVLQKFEWKPRLKQ